MSCLLAVSRSSARLGWAVPLQGACTAARACVREGPAGQAGAAGPQLAPFSPLNSPPTTPPRRRGLAEFVTGKGEAPAPPSSESVGPSDESLADMAGHGGGGVEASADSQVERSEVSRSALSGTYRVDYQASCCWWQRGSGGRGGAGRQSGRQRRAAAASPPTPPRACACLCRTHPHALSSLLSCPTLQKYPIAGYVKLPAALTPFVSLPSLDHVVVVAKPTGDVSGGLENYREVGWSACLFPCFFLLRTVAGRGGGRRR